MSTLVVDRHVALILATLTIGACGSSPTTQQRLDPGLAGMDVVSGNGQSAMAGADLPAPLVVRVMDEDGQPISGQVVNFRITAGGGSVFAGTAHTDTAGIAKEYWTLGATAGSPQALEARAVEGSSSDKQVFASFTATALDPIVQVASVTVTPPSANLTVGATWQMNAAARDANGDPVSGKIFTWKSSDTGVADVDSAGLVTANAAGDATIIAATGGESGTAEIAVTALASADTVPPAVPGNPTLATSAATADSFSVTASWRSAEDAATYAWRTASNSGAFSREGETTGLTVPLRAPRLDNASGYWFCVNAVDTAGNSSVEAACGNYSPPSTGPTTPVVTEVTVTPAAVSLAVGGKWQLTAMAADAAGDSISGKVFTWSSGDADVAVVSSSGLVTALAAGTATITASADGENGTATISVAAVVPVVASMTVSPSSAALTVGATRQLSASARDASGTAIPGKTFAWASSDTQVAAVSSAGLVTARAAGSATITASVDGERGEANVSVASPSGSAANECASRQAGWIWCDDFEQDRLGSYFEYDSQGGGFACASGVGVGESVGMRARFAQGQTNAGNLKLAFGRTPSSYMRPVDAGTANYREVYFRFYFMNAANWQGGGGDKLARTTSFAGSDWSQAMIAHVWSGGSGSSRNFLLIEPASGTDTQGNLQTSGYNDFDSLRWLENRSSTTPIFDASHVGEWHCVESRVRLNDAGQSNGAFQLWIDDLLEASVTDLNWVGAYSTYGINSVLVENFWNDGSPQQQERYFDNLVVSTQRIGCSS